MRLRVIQENNIVVITVLSLSEKIEKLRKRRFNNYLIKKYLPNYIGIILGSKKDDINSIYIEDNYIQVFKDSVGKTNFYRFNTSIKAEEFCTNLKNSIELINNGTEAKIAEVNSFIRDTNIFILE